MSDSIRIDCPKCNAKLTVSVVRAGKRGKCPNQECRAMIDIPLLPAQPLSALPDSTDRSSLQRNTLEQAQDRAKKTRVSHSDRPKQSHLTEEPLSWIDPAARYERLHALSVGEDPVEEFRISGVLLRKSGHQAQGGHGYLVLLGDLIVCDTGILICPIGMAPLAPLGDAAITGGLIGLTVAASQNAGKMQAARDSYGRLAHAISGWTPTEVFSQLPNYMNELPANMTRGSVAKSAENHVDYLPADEILAWGFASDRELVIRFRGIEYRIEKDLVDDKEAIAEWYHAFHNIEMWLQTAKDRRREAIKSPAKPNIASLVEWGQRPKSIPSSTWVLVAISACNAEGLSPRFRETIAQAGYERLRNLMVRLNTLQCDEARILGKNVRKLGLRSARLFLLGGLLALMVGGLEIGTIAMADSAGLIGKNNDSVPILGGLSVALLVLLSMFCIPYGLALWSKFPTIQYKTVT